MLIDMIEPYAFFPVCSYPLFESLLRKRNDISDLGYLYLGNTFEYSRAEEIKVINGELNISFGIKKYIHEETYDITNSKVNGYLAKKLNDIYGVTIYYKSFKNYNTYKEYIRKQLAVGEPIVCQYNLMFTPTKVQYKKRDGVHTIMILGERLENYTYDCMEEGVNPYFELKEEDLKKCFDYNVSVYGDNKVYIIKKEVEKIIDEHQLFCKFTDKIYNEEIEQLEILGKFVYDMNLYLKNKTDKKKFTIPNLWTISLEKKTTVRWIEKYMKNRNDIDELDKLGMLKNGIQETADIWVNIVFFLERNMYLKEWKNSDKLIDKLYEVQEKEIMNYTLWKMLKEK